jgi:cell division protein FtsB
MSEQTIPLRIADLAVAACNAEITKLQEENARLKQQVEELQNRCDYLEGKTDEA